MPSPRPIMLTTFCSRIDSDHACATNAAMPNVTPIASSAPATGRNAATIAPNATNSNTSVTGAARHSALRASAALVRRRSALSATCPVHRIVAEGWSRRSDISKRRVAWRSVSSSTSA